MKHRSSSQKKGHIAIIGAGPGGMATALAALRVGFDVSLFERAKEVRAAGNILNLWPPPQKVLKLLGVDVIDLGAPCHTVFTRNDGHLRADVRLSPKSSANMVAASSDFSGSVSTTGCWRHYLRRR